MGTAARARAYLRSLRPGLPRAVYTLQAGLVLNALGNGAVNPFLIIYLHDVRDVPLGVAGLVSATGALSALVAALAAGSLADRLGPKTTLLGGLVLSASANAGYPLIRESWHAFALAALASAGAGAWLTSQSSLLAAIAPPERRHAAFAQQRVAANLGLGLGGMIGGLIVVTSSPSTFTVLFLGNAATFVAYGAFVLRVPRVDRVPAQLAGGYRDVLRDDVFLRLTALNLVLVAAAISLLNSLAPVFAHDEAWLSERAIGLLFLLNTLVIVVAQVPVTRSQEGQRRMGTLAAMCVLWAVAWLLVLAAGFEPGAVAPILFAAAFVVFALGECLYDTVQGPLVADLAPSGLTGRYMAASGFSWQLGFILGPAGGAFLLAAAPDLFWLAPALLCMLAGGYALVLERALPPNVLRTPG